MAREEYVSKRFTSASLRLIGVMDEIIEDYMGQGYVLTVRQLYYQLVSRAIIPNTEKSYKTITGLVNDARLAGLLDWDGIEDRTRSFKSRAHWSSGAEIVQTCANQYHEDMWLNQPFRVFAIVEKEALAGVLIGVCDQLDVPLLAAKGYPSGSVLRSFAESRLLPAIEEGQEIVILHLGDHDPSGIDMTRDLQERIEMFTHGHPVEFKRIALNMPQIEEVNPPENPAKTTDSRFEDYRRKYGESSWELDALTPDYLTKLLRRQAEKYIDRKVWKESEAAIADVKERLQQVAEEF